MIRSDRPQGWVTSATAANRRGLVLALCLAAHTFVSIDRGVMAVLQEAVKRDLLLSDTELSMVSGLSFGIFFALASLPIGWLVDRFSRRNILAACVFVFSGATALTSLSAGFVQLLLIRSILGASEAGGVPAATSLLADLYPPAKRAGVFSIFYIGAPLGFVISFIVGGWVATHYGWRQVLLLAGLPGIVLAVIFWFLVKEPPRTVVAEAADQSLSPTDTFRLILAKRALLHIFLTAGLTSAGSAGLISFAGSFFVRLHGLDLVQVGLTMAIFYGAAGMIGSFAGGWFVDRLSDRDLRWPTWWCAAAYAVAAPAAVWMLLSPSLIGAVAGLTVVALATNSTLGSVVAVLQSLVTARMRGSITAAFAVMSYLFGMALGPMIVGGLSDLLYPHIGTAALRWAMLVAVGLYIWGAAHFVVASTHIRADRIAE